MTAALPSGRVGQQYSTLQTSGAVNSVVTDDIQKQGWTSQVTNEPTINRAEVANEPKERTLEPDTFVFPGAYGVKTM